MKVGLKNFATCRVFLNDKPDMSDPLNQFVMVGVKRYARGKQFGSVRKLDHDHTPEEMVKAEDACLLDTLMPVWARFGFFGGQM